MSLKASPRRHLSELHCLRLTQKLAPPKNQSAPFPNSYWLLLLLTVLRCPINPTVISQTPPFFPLTPRPLCCAITLPLANNSHTGGPTLSSTAYVITFSSLTQTGVLVGCIYGGQGSGSYEPLPLPGARDYMGGYSINTINAIKAINQVMLFSRPEIPKNF
jgi:hypothetical protein